MKGDHAALRLLFAAAPGEWRVTFHRVNGWWCVYLDDERLARRRSLQKAAELALAEFRSWDEDEVDA